jgi:hypothetical protein
MSDNKLRLKPDFYKRVSGFNIRNSRIYPLEDKLNYSVLKKQEDNKSFRNLNKNNLKVLISNKRFSFSKSPEDLDFIKHEATGNKQNYFEIYSARKVDTDILSLKNKITQSYKGINYAPPMGPLNLSPLGDLTDARVSEKYVRMKTPSFNKPKDEEMISLKEICDKLLKDQRIMKDQLTNQEIIIDKLNSVKEPLNLKTKHRSGNETTRARSRNGFKGRLKQEKDLYTDPLSTFTGTKFKCPSLNNSSVINSYKNSPRYEKESDITNIPFIFTRSPSKIRPEKISPMKYYKDKPQVLKNLRFPKEFFYK